MKKEFKKQEPISIKDLMETEAYSRLRAEINAEINNTTMIINRDEFIKTPQEKRELKFIKKSFLKFKSNKEVFSKSLTDLLGVFQHHKMPNWGGLVINGYKY